MNKGLGLNTVQNDNEFDILSKRSLTNKRLTEFRNFVAPAPNYVSPIALLSSSQTGVFEVGTPLSILLQLSFNQNDGGNPTNFNLLKNGASLQSQATAFDFTDDIILGRETITYKSRVNYEDGLIKNNPDFGFPDPRGQILAGSDDSPNKTVTGRLKVFSGATNAIPTNSAGVRALPNFDYENNNQILINTGTTKNKFIVAVPTLKTNAQSLSAQDITNNVPYTFALADVFNVNLNSGNGIEEYRIYAVEVDNPFPTNAQIQVNI